MIGVVSFSIYESIIFVSLLTMAMWVPYLAGVASTRGMFALLAGDPKADNRAIPEWAVRFNRAHQNALENLAPFIGICLVAILSGVEQAPLEFAATLFCLARLAHYICYGFGIPVLRTMFFTVGWIATGYIGVTTFIQL